VDSSAAPVGASPAKGQNEARGALANWAIVRDLALSARPKRLLPLRHQTCPNDQLQSGLLPDRHSLAFVHPSEGGFENH
jgi:hypothetical protein